jgi:hypothetical protein
MLTIEEQIRAYTLGLMGSESIVCLIKGTVQIPVNALLSSRGATRSEIILQMLQDGWTPIPFSFDF